MSSRIDSTSGSKFSEKLLTELRNELSQGKIKAQNRTEELKDSPSFMDHLKEGMETVNVTNKSADKMATDLATGRSENLHETMLAATHAELSFNLMVQVRNKVLEAYQEVMRMPV